jgi:hypothetical protein
MAYISGICNNVNPGPTLYALMDPALTAAGFTFVDTVVISTRTHKVWKSAAASNAANLDWYLDIGYPTTGAGNMTVQCFEYFDPATDLGYRGLYAGSSSLVIDATTSSRYGATGSALETNWIGATTFTTYATPIPATAFNYYISMTTNRLIMLLDNGATYPHSHAVTYVGLYTPDSLYAAKAGASIYPLVGFFATASPASMNLPFSTSATTVGSTSAALTRIPPATSMLNNGWGGSINVHAPWQLLGGKFLGNAQTNYPEVAVPFYIGNNNSNSAQAIGALYGVCSDVAVLQSMSAIRGDTVTIGGNTWVVSTANFSGNIGFSLLFKAI